MVVKAVGGAEELFGTLLFKKVQQTITQQQQQQQLSPSSPSHPPPPSSLWFTPDIRPVRRDSEEFFLFSKNFRNLMSLTQNYVCSRFVRYAFVIIGVLLLLLLLLLLLWLFLSIL